MKTKRLVEMELTKEEKNNLNHTIEILHRISIEMDNFNFDTVEVDYETISLQDIEETMNLIKNFIDAETMVIEAMVIEENASYK